MKNYYFLSAICFLFFSVSLSAQKVVQIEKYGNPYTEKIFIGDAVTYKLKDDKLWRFAYIEDILIEEGVILLGNRYTKVDDIEAFRYDKKWARAISTSLFWFGTAWSGFAAVGTATDGDDDTYYRWSDAIVTGTSWLSALAIRQLFRYKVIKFGKRKRLRLLDITITNPKPISPIP